jgi:hypothetical protein
MWEKEMMRPDSFMSAAVAMAVSRGHVTQLWFKKSK